MYYFIEVSMYRCLGRRQWLDRKNHAQISCPSGTTSESWHIQFGMSLQIAFSDKTRLSRKENVILRELPERATLPVGLTMLPVHILGVLLPK